MKRSSSLTCFIILTSLQFHRACKVSNGDEDLHRRECKGEATCTKGPYDAELNGKDVEVTFCERKEKEEENKGDGEKDKPFWVRKEIYFNISLCLLNTN